MKLWKRGESPEEPWHPVLFRQPPTSLSLLKFTIYCTQVYEVDWDHCLTMQNTRNDGIIIMDCRRHNRNIDCTRCLSYETRQPSQISPLACTVGRLRWTTTS